ncbi:hypothetical protein B7R21_19190 [Subtercola boreus]|uniref:DUF4440 domain-containing protein n=1 Tax=Subtercola boreus TaxID=120213 RepID=A0A3E0VBA9_9MICO|nr:nuclear transport factor 2 family protein [Subtercola boreus]RFA06640.1 hypothetical protein B7R21_19190 [Subtercola boreus]
MDETSATTTVELLISSLESQRITAAIEADIPTLDSLCHPRMVYTHTRGQRDSKRSLLEKIQSGFFNYLRIEHPETEIIVVGDTAVVIGHQTATIIIDSHSVELNNATTATWIHGDNRWQLLAFQPSPLPD